MQHIHSQLAQCDVPLEEAPDKEGELNDVDKNNTVENQLDEPVIVDQVESEADLRDRQIAESYINIHLKANLAQDAVQPVMKKADAPAVQKK